MGIYEQRKKETYMLRTRIPGGIVTLKQLKIISGIAKKYSNGKIRFTSRQDIQFHNINLDNIYNMMIELLEAGIITKGTGGNTARNVACSPLSGVAINDVFHVSEYAISVTSFLLKDPSTMNLPRKYKIAFSNSSADTANATISDLGFIAKIEDGKKGFEVYLGGGLGGSPRVSVKVADFIDGKNILYYVQALKELFERQGDRTNKNRARIRYIVSRLGLDNFVNLFNNQLEKVKRENNLDIFIDHNEDSRLKDNDNDIPEEFKHILIKQQQIDLYSLYIHPQSGNMDVNNLDIILDFLSNLNYQTSVRLTNTQGFFVRDLKKIDALNLLKITAEFTSKFSLFNSVTCAGPNTCQLGLCLPPNLLQAIKEEFNEASEKVKTALPRLFISGCPNSCAQHQKGAIGLSGKAKRTEDGLIPMYTLTLGGFVAQGGAKLGEVFGDIPSKKIPKFLYDLAKLKVESNNEDFYDFFEHNKEDIKDLINQYSNIESFDDNENIYFDFGSNEKFSLKGRGTGECSIGVLDVIKLDISNANVYLDNFNNTNNSLELYNAALSAARSLLVLKGIDTNKEREIFNEFVKNFIDTKYVKSSLTELIDNLLDYKIGDIKDISDKYSEVKYLVKRVKLMFESLNGQLEITIAKEIENISQEISSLEKSGHEGILDFRKIKCPINFVKVKLELEKIKSGERLEVFLDDGEPIENVPRSLEKEGHRIIEINKNFAGYNLLVIEKNKGSK